MNNRMPQTPSVSKDTEGKVNTLPEMPTAPEPASAVLSTPTHVAPVNKPSTKVRVDNMVPVKSVSQGIEVIAVNAAWFQGQYRKPGDRFLVPNENMLGSWMKCVDPNLDKKHQARVKERKKLMASV
jgi:hypothetical protein